MSEEGFLHRFRSLLSALKPTWLAVLFAVLIGFGVGFWQWIQPPRPRVVLENLGEGDNVVFSPDGKTLGIVQGLYDYSLTLWNVETGKNKAQLSLGEEEAKHLQFSPDGRTLAWRIGKKIRVWDLTNEEGPMTYDDKSGISHSKLIFSAEGKLLGLRGKSELWDVVANKLVKKLVLEDELVISDWGNVILVRTKGDIIKVWDLATASLYAESSHIPIPPKNLETTYVTLSSDRRFLIYHSLWVEGGFILDPITGAKQEISGFRGNRGSDLAPNRQSIAFGLWDPMAKQPGGNAGSWWTWFKNRLGIQAETSEYYVVLQTFPSGEKLIVLNDCHSPLFSPDGKILAVRGSADGSLQLWDLPIRKPIGKILGLAALAAVATLPAFNGLGWLRRRRMRLKANVVPNSVPSAQ
jgi:WD40 repeat protein